MGNHPLLKYPLQHIEQVKILFQSQQAKKLCKITNIFRALIVINYADQEDWLLTQENANFEQQHRSITPQRAMENKTT